MAGREPCQKIVEGYYGSQQRCGTVSAAALHLPIFATCSKSSMIFDELVMHDGPSARRRFRGGDEEAEACFLPEAIDAQRSTKRGRIAAIARETGVATQIAVANQASRRHPLVYVSGSGAGAIGPVREVVNWSSRPFWPQGVERPKKRSRCQKDWIGICGSVRLPERPFNHAYLPFSVARMVRLRVWRAGRYGLLTATTPYSA